MSPFACHSGAQRLICSADMPPGPGGPFGVTVAELQAMGWDVSERELRRVLPRFDRNDLTTGLAAQAAMRTLMAGKR